MLGYLNSAAGYPKYAGGNQNHSSGLLTWFHRAVASGRVVGPKDITTCPYIHESSGKLNENNFIFFEEIPWDKGKAKKR